MWSEKEKEFNEMTRFTRAKTGFSQQGEESGSFHLFLHPTGRVIPFKREPKTFATTLKAAAYSDGRRTRRNHEDIVGNCHHRYM